MPAAPHDEPRRFTPPRPITPAEAGMPLYRAVKRELLAAIEAGTLPPGATLPSEAALAAGWGVSIGTLRHAVDELVAEHLLVRRQGRGTFVATHSEDRFLFQFFHVERADGLREAPQVELIAFERGRADEESASALWLRPGEPLILVENRLRLQGRPVVHDALALPAALFKGLTEKRLRERPLGAPDPARVDQDHPGTRQKRQVQRRRPFDRIAAVRIDLAFALGVDDHRRHRGRGARDGRHAAVVHALGRQALAQEGRGRVVAHTGQQPHLRAQPGGRDRRVVGHAATLHAVATRWRLAGLGRKGADLPDMVERGVADAGEGDGRHDGCAGQRGEPHATQPAPPRPRPWTSLRAMCR
jgi:DNA-binding GntR family transcriptional regulator